MWSPCECLYRILVLMSRGYRVNGFAVSLGRIRDTDSVVSAVPVRGSQNLIRLSLLPDTSRPIVGCYWTHLTSHPWPVRMRSSRLSAKDQTRTAESSLAVANRSSSGEKLSPRTASRRAGHAVRLVMLGWKYLTIPDWSADAM